MVFFAISSVMRNQRWSLIIIVSEITTFITKWKCRREQDLILLSYPSLLYWPSQGPRGPQNPKCHQWQRIRIIYPSRTTICWSTPLERDKDTSSVSGAGKSAINTFQITPEKYRKGRKLTICLWYNNSGCFDSLEKRKYCDISWLWIICCRFPCLRRKTEEFPWTVWRQHLVLIGKGSS